MEITKTNPNTFISSLPEPEQSTMAKLDKLITAAAPKQQRVMWEGKFWGGSDQKIIGYGYQTVVGSSKKPVEWFVIGLAAQKDYFSIHVSVFKPGGYQLVENKAKLGKVKTTKSLITFKKLEDLNLDELKVVVKQAFQVYSSK